jgi:hypothetical protein
MVNQWIEHIKKWSKKNNVSYSCAISMPECKNEYQLKKKSNIAVTTKPNIAVTTKPNIAVTTKPNENKILIDNWDDDYLNNLLYTSEIGRNIEKLIMDKNKKNMYVIDIFLLSLTKPINNEIINKYGVKALFEGIDNYVDYIGAKKYSKIFGVEKNLPIKQYMSKKSMDEVNDLNEQIILSKK